MEQKNILTNLLANMIEISNDSVVTNNAARIISENIDGNDIETIKSWISLVKTEVYEQKTVNAKIDYEKSLGFGTSLFKRY